MKRKPPTWERIAPGVKLLKLYETHLNPDWPRIVILELTADRFKEFEHDTLGFDKKYRLFYPESPISWISTCAKPPQVKEIPLPEDSSSWTVAVLKHTGTRAACAACFHEPS